MKEKRHITKADLYIAAKPAPNEPSILEHALLDGWQDYRLCHNAIDEPPLPTSRPKIPFDHYRICTNCNCLIEHNSEVNINNHHLVIVFFRQDKPVRLYAGFDEDVAIIPSIMPNLEKLYHQAEPPLTISEFDFKQKPIINPSFRPDTPEDQIYPCADLQQLHSHLNHFSTQADFTTHELQLSYSSVQHLICHLDLPGKVHPGYHFELAYKGGFFSSELQTILPLLQPT